MSPSKRTSKVRTSFRLLDSVKATPAKLFALVTLSFPSTSSQACEDKSHKSLTIIMSNLRSVSFTGVTYRLIVLRLLVLFDQYETRYSVSCPVNNVLCLSLRSLPIFIFKIFRYFFYYWTSLISTISSHTKSPLKPEK